MANISNKSKTVDVNSKTLSVFKLEDITILDDYLEHITITTLDNGKVFIESNSVELSKEIYNKLVEAGNKVKIVSYSLFFRFSDEVTETEARDIFMTMNSCNITFLRVDTNKHTGKLVVDTWDDYKSFKDFEDEEETIRFFHFDTKAKSKRKNKFSKKKDENDE